MASWFPTVHTEREFDWHVSWEHYDMDKPVNAAKRCIVVAPTYPDRSKEMSALLPAPLPEKMYEQVQCLERTLRDSDVFEPVYNLYGTVDADCLLNQIELAAKGAGLLMLVFVGHGTESQAPDAHAHLVLCKRTHVTQRQVMQRLRRAEFIGTVLLALCTCHADAQPPEALHANMVQGYGLPDNPDVHLISILISRAEQKIKTEAAERFLGIICKLCNAPPTYPQLESEVARFWKEVGGGDLPPPIVRCPRLQGTWLDFATLPVM